MLLSPLRYINPISGNRGGSTFSIAKSFYFDGVDEYFNVDSLVANISTNTVGTINILTKSANIFPAQPARIFSFGDTDANNRLQVSQLADGTIGFVAVSGGLQFNISTDNAIDLTNWTLITAVQDGVQPVIYINGVAVAQSNISAIDLTFWLNDVPSIDNCSIGGLRYSLTSQFSYKGYVSQVSYINTNISSAQVLDLNNNGKPKNPQSLFGTSCKLFFNPDNSGDTAQFSVVDSVNSITATSVNMEDADKTTETPY